MKNESTNPCRVVGDKGTLFDVKTSHGLKAVTATSVLMSNSEIRPAVGDWVILNDTEDRIEEVVPRTTAIARQAAGHKTKRQVIAANVDVVFIVTSMNQDLNESRLERYLSMVWSSGATPVILINKSDLSDEPKTYLDRASGAAMGCEVLAVNTIDPGGLDPMLERLKPDGTYLLVGSSGVGKSTITNVLFGEMAQPTAEIREEDDEGRHTTTSRRLVVLPFGRGSLIDTPGMREIQLWDADEGVSAAFADIEDVIVQCRFRDCGHEKEPGCAIRASLEDGTLDARRFENYLKLQSEAAFHQKKRDVAQTRADQKKLARMYKSVIKAKSRKT